MILDLTCIRCGVAIRREERSETWRIKAGRSGPFCSRTCTSRQDDPRDHPEPDPVSGARWIRLTRGKFALVDEDRFEELNSRQWHWATGGTSYGHASSGSRNTFQLLHHVVLGTDPKVTCIDHRDNNGLDCRRENLRVSTRTQNGANREKFVGRPGRTFTSKYKGVIDRLLHGAALNARWLTRIRVEGRLIRVGAYETECEAAVAYDAAAIHYFGEFAKTNFPWREVA